MLCFLSYFIFLSSLLSQDKWIGGFKDPDGREISCFDGLKQILAPAFELESDEDMPFFIRETARKNQWTVAHVTVWRRKS